MSTLWPYKYARDPVSRNALTHGGSGALQPLLSKHVKHQVGDYKLHLWSHYLKIHITSQLNAIKLCSQLKTEDFLLHVEIILPFQWLDQVHVATGKISCIFIFDWPRQPFIIKKASIIWWENGHGKALFHWTLLHLFQFLNSCYCRYLEHVKILLNCPSTKQALFPFFLPVLCFIFTLLSSGKLLL